MLCFKELVARRHLILRGKRLIALSSRWGQEITTLIHLWRALLFLPQKLVLGKGSGRLNGTIFHLSTN
jgi:hypothetical protein